MLPSEIYDYYNKKLALLTFLNRVSFYIRWEVFY